MITPAKSFAPDNRLVVGQQLKPSLQLTLPIALKTFGLPSWSTEHPISFIVIDFLHGCLRMEVVTCGTLQVFRKIVLSCKQIHDPFHVGVNITNSLSTFGTGARTVRNVQDRRSNLSSAQWSRACVPGAWHADASPDAIILFIVVIHAF